MPGGVAGAAAIIVAPLCRSGVQGPNADWVTQLYLSANIMHILHKCGGLNPVRWGWGPYVLRHQAHNTANSHNCSRPIPAVRECLVGYTGAYPANGSRPCL
jgi:hypothetical protein